MAGSIFGFSVPNFWQGMVFILFFAVWLGWLPASGRGPTVDFLGVPLSIFSADGWRHIALPAVNLAIANIPLVLRMTAPGVRHAERQDVICVSPAQGSRTRQR